MKLLRAAILLNILAIYGICADNGIDPQPVPTNSTIAPPTSSTSTTTSTTTSATTSVTTSSTTTSSTARPTTSTTTKPITNATTTSTTTTSTPTTSTSTTSAPTSSPVPPTTTAPPEPEQRTWEVVNSTSNTSCILLKMVAEIDITYLANATKEAHISVPTNATASGTCGDAKNTNQSITLTWSFVNGFNDTLQFTFSKNDKKFELDTINLTVVLEPWNFPDATDPNKTLSFIDKDVEFVTPVEMSYKCAKQQNLKLQNPNNNGTVATFTISKFQFQAFGNITNKHFAEAKDCEPYETPDIVPIAVGCALMALIIIVLIGYLIGRRRNQARGYLSMFTENKKEADYIPMKNLSCFQ